MVGRGLYEIVGWSFAEPGLLDRLRLPAETTTCARVVRVENPLSEAQSIMRPTLLGSLLDAARHNVSRNGPDVAIFESGTVYRGARERRRAGPADEHHALGVLLSGALAPRSWRGERARGGLLRRQGAARRAARALHVDWSVEPARRWPFLHPGRSAAVLASGDGRSRPAGLPRRAAPAGGRRVGPRAHGGVRDRPRQARRGRAGGRRVPRVRRRSRRCARTSP